MLTARPATRTNNIYFKICAPETRHLITTVLNNMDIGQIICLCAKIKLHENYNIYSRLWNISQIISFPDANSANNNICDVRRCEMLYFETKRCPECKKTFNVPRGGVVDVPPREIVCPHCGHKFSFLERLKINILPKF